MKLGKIFLALSTVLMAGNASADSFDKMMSPVSNPVNFEDPRARSEVRPIYLYHKLDDKFVTAGGQVQIWALQLRYAVDDRLAIIANKDGIVNFQPNSVLNDDVGFGNLAGGVKYAFYKDDASRVIGTGGLTYEAPTGSKGVLQGKGNGFIRPFFSAGYAGEGVNLIGSTGLRVRMDSDDSSFWDADLHLDIPVGASWFPGLEMNLVHVIDGGKRLPIKDEGADYFSFGSSEAGGETILTGAVVSRVALTDALNWGIAYQFPMSSGDGSRVFDWRLTTDVIYSF